MNKTNARFFVSLGALWGSAFAIGISAASAALGGHWGMGAIVVAVAGLQVLREW